MRLDRAEQGGPRRTLADPGGPWRQRGPGGPGGPWRTLADPADLGAPWRTLADLGGPDRPGGPADCEDVAGTESGHVILSIHRIPIILQLPCSDVIRYRPASSGLGIVFLAPQHWADVIRLRHASALQHASPLVGHDDLRLLRSLFPLTKTPCVLQADSHLETTPIQTLSRRILPERTAMRRLRHSPSTTAPRELGVAVDCTRRILLPGGPQSAFAK